MRKSGIIVLAGVILIFTMWELACRILSVPDFILPAPTRILAVAVFQAPILLPHAAVTALEIIMGISLSLLVAVPLATMMYANPSIERAISPFLVVSQAIPVFALAPLFIVWFGYGIAGKVFMAAIIIFFPITVSLLEGYKNCDSEYVMLFRLMGAILGYPAVPLLAVGAPLFLCRPESGSYRCDHRRRDRRMGGSAAGTRVSHDSGKCEAARRYGFCRHPVVVRHGNDHVDMCRHH